MTERAVVFSCAAQPMVGIVHEAAVPSDTAVLIVVGGPQYRGGSHRQFVQLARRLAAEGVASMRFDVRGMGDSGGGQRGFDALDDDIAAALDTLQSQLPAVRRVVLWGLCDGASAALLYLEGRADPRITGLVVVNPWVRSEATLARTHVKHYYRQRLMQREFWGKLLKGGVALRAASELGRNLVRALRPAPAAQAAAGAQAPFAERMATAWRGFSGPLLLILSGNDYTAREFVEHATTSAGWRGLVSSPRVSRHDIEDADHTFSDPPSQKAMEAATVAWLQRNFP
ncbi:hydrolase 1, exosortase A system-associated [Aquincola sp. MAHUQ-54]|uniref:Hydrolase 1, exosortase A system-associated n=1 Tax=Aquincola agrisoli TaxID=3119538 RepID=A0AAW9QN49_9BURK